MAVTIELTDELAVSLAKILYDNQNDQALRDVHSIVAEGAAVAYGEDHRHWVSEYFTVFENEEDAEEAARG